jgi:anthranilate synthase/aminodeoxychorismate synthase-like glutamine amidotransferase
MNHHLLLIDNYDSFTYNLVQYFGELGADIAVYRNDKITVEEAVKLTPSHLVLSPGPGHPKNAGRCRDLTRAFLGKIPILGVCLGHQSISHTFGGTVDLAPRMVHGKISRVYHDGKGVFRTLPNPIEATRYHSLIVDSEKIPTELEITAHTSEGEVMGVRHREHPVEGVQFHPESIMTREGMTLLQNFLEMKAE